MLILVTYLALTTAWNLILPAYENLDELEHAEVVRYVADTGRLPVHGKAERLGYRVRQEASQPPLYYLLAAGWSRLWRLPAEPHDPAPVPGDVVACGPSPTFYNKVTWIHDPDEARLPWQGPYRTLHLLRLFSALLQAFTVAGAWTLARRIAPRSVLPLLTAGFVAFNPQFLMLAAGVNNDNAVIPLATWGLVLALDLWNRGPTVGRALGLGVLGGLAALSKLSGFGLIGLGGLILLIEGFQQRRPFGRLVVHDLLLTLPALILVAPWLLRNLRLYGDPTALAPMLEEVGARAGGVSLGEARLMLRSYWGQLPCTFYPRALYWPYYLFIIGGLGGVIVGWRRLRARQKRALFLCAIWFTTILLAWARWNRMTFATGGRLLFPASAAVALILATGWRSLGDPGTRLWGGLLPVISIITLVSGVIPVVTPPVMATAEDAASLGTPRSESITFGEHVTLEGYRVSLTQPWAECIFKSSAYCGTPALDLRLDLRANRPPTENWILVIQLTSAVPGETDLRLNYNHWPGRGTLPTSVWPSGALIHDRYTIPLPHPTTPTQAWRVQVAFVNPQTGARIPVSREGEGSGDAAHLRTLRVPGRERPSVAWAADDPTVDFGEKIQLTGAEVNPSGDGLWRVRLLWESTSATPENYVIFVHAYDGSGELLTTGDAPPLNGGFPTQLWEPGDQIVTTHTLEVGAAFPETVKVGLYEPAQGTRLPAVSEGIRLQDDAAVIWNRQ